MLLNVPDISWPIGGKAATYKRGWILRIPAISGTPALITPIGVVLAGLPTGLTVPRRIPTLLNPFRSPPGSVITALGGIHMGSRMLGMLLGCVLHWSNRRTGRCRDLRDGICRSNFMGFSFSKLESWLSLASTKGMTFASKVLAFSFALVLTLGFALKLSFSF